MENNTINLNGKWIMKGVDKFDNQISVPVTVPCTVHQGLAENNMLFDGVCKNTDTQDLSEVFYGDNADKVGWIEDKEWIFEREFDVKLNESIKKLEIEFKGLDTYCEIYINNKLLAACKNMHIVHTFDILDYVADGKNTLKVKFLPPVKEDEKCIQRDYNGAFSGKRLYTRRMQCTYGWDWVNRFVTMGIFGDVTLHINRFVKIDCLKAELKGLTAAGAAMELYIKGDIDKKFFDGAFKDRSYHFEKSPMICFSVCDPDGNEIYNTEMLFAEDVITDYLTIENPRLWYPTGYGESPVYTLSAKIKDENGIVITEKTVNFGIRGVCIVEKFDKEGSKTYKKAEDMFNLLIKKDKEENEFASFDLYVNGVRIICKGANWVPADPFPGNVSYNKYDALLSLVKEGNMNMLRIWGGGIFEDDEFYNLCDKYGIMIQQDFLFACGNYPYCDEYLEDPTPEEFDFVENIKAETEQNVQRLVSHPSIMWWNGNNENETAGNANLLNNARRIAGNVSAPILRKYDGHRRFFMSSPWGGSYNNSPSKGLYHGTGYLDLYFDFIKETDMVGYAEHFGKFISRFSNENPILSCPTESSVKRFLPESEMTTDSFDGYIYHTKNHPDDKYKEFGLFHHMDMGGKKLFGDFKDGKDRTYKMGILGYEWARTVMEGVRSNEDFTSGNIFWMFNDCWPALGWSIVDYYGTPKAAYYGMKKTSAKVCSAIKYNNNEVEVCISNDGTEEKTAKVVLSVVNSNEVEYFEECTIQLASQSRTTVKPKNNEKFTFDDTNKDTKIIVCDVVGDDFEDRTYYTHVVPGKLKLDGADVNVQVLKDSKEVILKSDKLALFVWMDGDYIFSDNCLMLLPGEEKKVTFKESFDHLTDDIKVMWLNK